MKKGILVCARTGSSRLPNKMVADVNGRSVIQYLLERMQTSKKYDELIFCTTHLKGTPKVFLKASGQPCFMTMQQISTMSIQSDKGAYNWSKANIRQVVWKNCEARKIGLQRSHFR